MNKSPQVQSADGIKIVQTTLKMRKYVFTKT